MERWGEFWRRIWFLFRENGFNQEMEEEIRFHLDRKAEQNVGRGMSDDEAGYAAPDGLAMLRCSRRRRARRGAGALSIISHRM
jgi:hypothetical protein